MKTQEELIQELYLERNLLSVCLAHAFAKNVTKSWRDGNGVKDESNGGWFILTFDVRPVKQFSYHVPAKYWEYLPEIKETEKNDAYDGHTKAEAIERLDQLAQMIHGRFLN